MSPDCLFYWSSEGYEKLAQARMQGTSTCSGQEKSKLEISTSTNDSDDAFDMFAEDDVNIAVNLASDGSGSAPVQPSEGEQRL